MTTTRQVIAILLTTTSVAAADPWTMRTELRGGLTEVGTAAQSGGEGLNAIGLRVAVGRSPHWFVEAGAQLFELDDKAGQLYAMAIGYDTGPIILGRGWFRAGGGYGLGHYDDVHLRLGGNQDGSSPKPSDTFSGIAFDFSLGVDLVRGKSATWELGGFLGGMIGGPDISTTSVGILVGVSFL